MASKAQVERAILEREGFRVELELFDRKPRALPPYEFAVMAPQRWKVSDWKNARLSGYRLLVKGAAIYRGDGTPIPRDLQLGNLRDSYYQAQYGSLRPPGDGDEGAAKSKVTPLRAGRKRASNDGKAPSRKRP